MNNSESDHTLIYLRNLLNALNPDLISLEEILAQLIKIETPYKAKFACLKALCNYRKKMNHNLDIEKRVNLIIQELNEFGSLINKIIKDENVSDLYIKTGLIEKLTHLQKSIAEKIV